MGELLPCPNPWCSSKRTGGGLHVQYYESACYYRVRCDTCPQIGPAGDTKIEAIAAWNHRANPCNSCTGSAADDGEVERLLTNCEGPHEWGYRDVADGSFITDDAPFRLVTLARAALAAARLPDDGARERQAAEDGWRPIAEVPYGQDVEVRVGHMTFQARLIRDGSMTSESETCDQWEASIEGEHPPCWSGGACWQSNEDEVASLQPTHYRPLPDPPASGEGSHG